MERVITLLQQKNHFLEKFYTLNESELLSFAQGNFDDIELFYQNRERIIEAIQYIDTEIQKINGVANEAFVLSMTEKQMMKEAMAIKEEYVHRIIAQDLEILASIEKAKSQIIRELQDLQKGKKGISGYRTSSLGSRLDEEV